MKIDAYKVDELIAWLEVLSDFDTNLTDITDYDLQTLDTRLFESHRAVKHEKAIRKLKK